MRRVILGWGHARPEAGASSGRNSFPLHDDTGPPGAGKVGPVQTVNATFDALFTAEDAHILLSAPRAPKMNALCERVIGTIRSEALDHVLIINTSHATKVLTKFADHHNRHRPHRSRSQLPPDASQQTQPAINIQNCRLLRTRVLGGAINEYRYAA
jgi:putative transposase